MQHTGRKQQILFSALRIVLVFSLVFFSTWQLQYSLAYGDEPTDDPTSSSSSSSTPDPNPGGDTGGTGDDTGDGGSSGTGGDNTGGNSGTEQGGSTEGGEGEGGGQSSDPKPQDDPAPTSYAYVKSIEILKDKGDWKDTENEKEKRLIKIETGDEAATYTFRAKVIVVLDSNNPKDETFICTGKEGLSKLTGGKLPDLKWEVLNASGKPEDERPSAEVASFDPEKPGTLKLAPNTSVTVRCLSNKGFGGGETSGQIPVETVAKEEKPDPQDDPKPQPVTKVSISYDANGGSGSMEGSTSDETGSITIAENAFTAPTTGTATGENTESENTEAESNPEDGSPSSNAGTDGTSEAGPANEDNPNSETNNSNNTDNTSAKTMVFSAWNTAADGSGTSFAPGTILSADGTPDEFAALLAAAQNSNSQGGSSDSSSEADTTDGEAAADPGEADDNTTTASATETNVHVVLYAQWVEQANGDNSGGGDYKAGPHVEISYTYDPIAQEAILSPIIGGVGHITFAYVWERSTDGGANWDYLASTSVTEMRVKVASEIGNQYRVSVYADSVIDKANNSRHITSDPVTIKEPDNSFAVVLLYSPVAEGENAIFSATAAPQEDAARASYEWFVSGDFGASWTPIADAQGQSYSVPTNEANMGNWYRVKARLPEAGTTNVCDDGNTQDDCKCDPNVACSNIQMLVAIAPNADPIPIDEVVNGYNTGSSSSSSANPTGDNTNNSSSSSSSDSSSSDSSSSDSSSSDSSSSDSSSDDSSSNANQDSSNNSRDRSDDTQDYTPDDQNNNEPNPDSTSSSTDQSTPPSPALEPQDPGNPTPPAEDFAPQPTPAPSQPSFVPIDSIKDAKDPTAGQDPGLNVLVDQDVNDKIAEEKQAQEAQELAQPGAKWRKLSVIPQAEEIQEVLESNPLAPFVAPFVIAFMACGMLERFLAFRRQTQTSHTSFA